MIRKLIFYALLGVLALGSYYLSVDYLRFKNEHAKTHTNILVLAPGTIEGTYKQVLINKITELATARPDITIDIANLKPMNLPFISASRSPLEQETSLPAVKEWGNRMAHADALIALVPDVNDGYPAEFKNAIDLLWNELHNKPVGIIVYSTHGVPSNTLIESLKALFKAVKCDPVTPIIRIDRSSSGKINDSAYQDDRLKEINVMIDAVVDKNLHRSYFKQLIRSIGNKIRRRVIRLLNPKKE